MSTESIVITRPALGVRIVMGPMTRVLNPLIRKAAGRKHIGMLAQVHHRGRRSGRAYVTPVTARPVDDRFLVALTFGSQSDWCRNVLAAGGCTLRWKEHDYNVTEPRLINRQGALPDARLAFKLPERIGFRVLRIKQFLSLRVESR